MATMTTSRAFTGPAVFSYGFRPFFLGAAIWGAAMVAVWVGVLHGGAPVPSALPPVDWHVHELLYGMIVAVVAGFLLTAVPNWTGRLPVAGAPLAALFGLWVAGRLAIAASAAIGIAPALGIALLFPLAMIAVAAREIAAAGNLRNLPVVAILGVFAAGEAAFAAELLANGHAVYGQRVSIAAALLLVSLIGGRVTPSFTTNWLKKQGATRLPAPFGRFDRAVLLVTAAALALWVASPALGAAWPGAVLVAAGVLAFARQARWRPLATVREPLVLVLHAGLLFVPVGFLLAGAGLLAGRPLIAHAAIHAWTIGALALMILAVMTRASRGHTGRDLTAPPATVALYLALVAAAAARMGATLDPALFQPLIALAGALFVAAFGGFALLYGPMLLTRRSGT